MTASTKLYDLEQSVNQSSSINHRRGADYHLHNYSRVASDESLVHESVETRRCVVALHHHLRRLLRRVACYHRHVDVCTWNDMIRTFQRQLHVLVYVNMYIEISQNINKWKQTLEKLNQLENLIHSAWRQTGVYEYRLSCGCESLVKIAQ